jgi:hypothetical protein
LENEKTPEFRYAADGQKYFTTTSKGYWDAIAIAIDYFESKFGYEVIHGYVCYNEKNRPASIANLFCTNEKGEMEDLALLVTFPKRKQYSTKRLLERMKRLGMCFSSVGVIMVHSVGSGSFPIVTDRLWKQNRLARCFSIDLKSYLSDKRKPGRHKSFHNYMRELINPLPLYEGVT